MNTFIIAEAGVNHNGDLGLAKELIAASAETGADAVKFQTFTAEKLVTASAKKAAYQNHNDGTTSTQFEMLKQLELGLEDFLGLAEECDKYNIEFMTTCFDRESLNYLNDKGLMRRLKIGSGDLTNLPLIYDHALTKSDIILSTGMANMGEIEEAIATCILGYEGVDPYSEDVEKLIPQYYTIENLRKYSSKITVLQCVTDYPAKPESLNLKVIDTYKNNFLCKVGYSDHSLGNEACLAAVAIGAEVLEKHITLSKQMKGPDHAASAEPKQFEQLVKSVRDLEVALGMGVKVCTPAEIEIRSVARKYLVAKWPIEIGQKFTLDNVEVKRCDFGVSPKMLWKILESESKSRYEVGEPLRVDV